MTGPTPSDAQLLAPPCTSADFGAVYDRHARHLYQWFLREGAPASDAPDLLAELFAQAWRSRQRFRDPGDGSARPWLYGIAKNLIRRYRRRLKVDFRARSKLGMPVGTAVDAADAVNAQVDAAARRDDLDQALSGLPPPQRTAVRLHVVEELSYPAVAAAMGCTEVTARKRVSQGLLALRSTLEEHE
jgi:RNA polymerase sigma factor (sigma-70 family)